MPLLHLVRHGRAAAGWGGEPDPGLDAQGVGEAAVAADRLAAELTTRPVWSSPRARARQTAEPLARAWGVEVTVDVAFDEIPSPSGSPASRRGWLAEALAGGWDSLGTDVDRWRAAMVASAVESDADRVIFTHFVAINALVAAATGDQRVTVFRPANASITVLEVDPVRRTLGVVALGGEATTDIG